MMKYLKTKTAGLVLACIFAAAAGGILVNKTEQLTQAAGSSIIGKAYAQSGPAGAIQAIYPLTRDLGVLIKPASSGGGVYSSADQSGYNVSRVMCVYNVAASSGAPTTNSITIQNKDIASGLYYGVSTSGTAVTVNTPVYTANGAGLSVTNGATVGAVPVASKWRVQLNVGSAGAAVTGTVGCAVQ
jgi:hypothetical protein